MVVEFAYLGFGLEMLFFARVIMVLVVGVGDGGWEADGGDCMFVVAVERLIIVSDECGLDVEVDKGMCEVDDGIGREDERAELSVSDSEEVNEANGEMG